MEINFRTGYEAAVARQAEATKLGAEPRLIFGLPDPGTIREAYQAEAYMRGVREVLPMATFFYTEVTRRGFAARMEARNRREPYSADNPDPE